MWHKHHCSTNDVYLQYSMLVELTEIGEEQCVFVEAYLSGFIFQDGIKENCKSFSLLWVTVSVMKRIVDMPAIDYITH